MSVVSEIINGYKNYFVKDEVVEGIALTRADICSQCEFKKKGLHSAILPDLKLGQIKGHYCGACGCPLSAIVRSISYECPKGKW